MASRTHRDSPLLKKFKETSPPKPIRPTKAKLMILGKKGEGRERGEGREGSERGEGREGAHSSESMHFSDLESTRYDIYNKLPF